VEGDTVAVRDAELDLDDVDEAKADNVDELVFETVGVEVDDFDDEIEPVADPDTFADFVDDTDPVLDFEADGDLVPTGDADDDADTDVDGVEEGVVEEDLEGKDDLDEDAEAPDDLVPDDVFEADIDASGVFVALVVLVDEEDEPLDRVPEGVIDDVFVGREVLVVVRDNVEVLVEVPERDAVPVRLFVDVDVRVGLALGKTSRPPARRLANDTSSSSSSSPSLLVRDPPRTLRPFRSRYFQK
jgi:hypothetical protein